jgi:hypothetical protein
MFGLPNKDKIKAAFQAFEAQVGDKKSFDLVVNSIVEFIRALSKAFEEKKDHDVA